LVRPDFIQGLYNGAPASPWGEAGKASSPLLLSIRPDDGDDCHNEIGSNHCTQHRKKDLVVHMFPPLWPFLEPVRAFPAFWGHFSNRDQCFLVPVKQALIRGIILNWCGARQEKSARLRHGRRYRGSSRHLILGDCLCRLWVRSRHNGRFVSSPLCPQPRTLSVQGRMSENCHEQTWQGDVRPALFSRKPQAISRPHDAYVLAAVAGRVRRPRRSPPTPKRFQARPKCRPAAAPWYPLSGSLWW
jgi:hypothetical protein